MIVRILCISLCLVLSACAARTPLPQGDPQLHVSLPVSMHIQRQTNETTEDWLLVIQPQAQGSRWSLFDLIGTPLARQQLSAGQWHDEGLLPPNDETRELFSALLFSLSTVPGLRDNYPADSWTGSAMQRTLRPDWRVSYSDELHFTLEKGEHVRYQFSPLADNENP